VHAAVAVPAGDRERLEHRTIWDCGLRTADCGLICPREIGRGCK
jgi:hypothetical protein